MEDTVPIKHGLFHKPTSPFTFDVAQQPQQQHTAAVQNLVNQVLPTQPQELSTPITPEVPVQEELPPVTEEDTPAVQEQPVPEPVTTQQPQAPIPTSLDTPPAGRIVVRRYVSTQDMEELVSHSTHLNGIKICHPHNATLRKFLLSYVFTNHQVPATIFIDGSSIAGGKARGIWEEGGEHGEFGSVLVATTPSGDPIAPITVFHNRNFVSGRHALVPLANNFHIIIGGYYENREVLAVYRIRQADCKHAAPVTTDNVDIVLPETYNCELTACRVNGTWAPARDVVASAIRWDDTHPAIQAASARMYENYAVAPCYVNKYRNQKVTPDIYADLSDCLTDSKYMASGVRCAGLEDAYARADGYIHAAMTDIVDRTKYQDMMPLMGLYLVYMQDTKDVAVHIFIVNYDKTHKSSATAGNRLWYGQVLIGPSDKFWYPDQLRSQAIDYRVLIRDLTSRKYNGRSLLVLRRMTID